MKKLKLLYAEDERRVRKDFVIYLESMYEFTIYEADNGEEALELFKKHKPEIVLTDITMPKMDGLTLAKEIRKISKHTKIIILTAHSEQEKLMEAFDSNIVNYLLKPVQRKRLRESLDIAIETLSQPIVTEVDMSLIHFAKNATFNTSTQEYMVDKLPIHLSKSECAFLTYLCKNQNIAISVYDIFLHIWDDYEREFSATSVRTLVKKLRKKLPKETVVNVYGGYYKINI